jgi:PPOX class probable F420-dependent enzyme
MASKRDQIKMTDEELRGFLDEQKIVTLATIGPGGRPHLMPLWFVRDEGDELRGWTFAKSQKAKNLERDPRATLQVETGEEYQELRGVMFECDVEVSREESDLFRIADDLVDRYAGGNEQMKEFFRGQAPKRVALRFTPTRTVTWDHRKLGGTY